ncbi:hypothetical protein BDZ89DRAFT_1069367 [Hymenopellis radicata]|nr:hypothetical protein BDZ89DRAFT_1069367 [Hymenopellis radicata]
MAAGAGPSSRPFGRRSRRSPRPLSRSPSPSASLLSLLASVAATVPTVDGSPAPLHFLCPRYSAATEFVEQAAVADAPPYEFPPETSTSTVFTRRRVPPKYEQKDDGLWRKVETYTLYGSTMCTSCAATTSSVDASNQAAATGTSSTDAASTSDVDTTLIVTLSLVLAFVICFLIIGCLFWRKNIRRKFRQHDIEMKAITRGRREGNEEDEEALTERGMRRKKKLWARATARWKANARARQRRGKRTLVTNASRSSLHADTPTNEDIEDRDDTMSYVSASRSISRQTSRRSSSLSREEITPTNHSLSASSSNVSLSNSADPASSSLSPPASPPAYHTPRLVVPDIRISTSNLEVASSAPKSVRPSHSSLGHLSSTDDSDDLSYTPSAAHVATDDKSLLARLNEMASHPPQQDSGHDPSESSAPVWEDEEIDDFELDSSGGDPSGSSPPTRTAFPPPPVPVSSKGKMAAEYFDYDYSYSAFDEDIQALEPELGPSAPPFEAVASAPPLPDDVPSAPNIDVDLGECVASAPHPPPDEIQVVISPPHYQS